MFLYMNFWNTSFLVIQIVKYLAGIALSSLVITQTVSLKGCVCVQAIIHVVKSVSD